MGGPLPRLAPTRISLQRAFACIVDIAGAESKHAADARSIRE